MNCGDAILSQSDHTAIYTILKNHFGHRNWWPGDTKFEIIVGAILTQNTNWKNVEKAIKNLKKSRIFQQASF